MSTYTYSGDPNSTPKDTVRFLLHDTGPVPPNSDNTVPTGWNLSDEEIAFLLTQDDNVYMAAALGATQIAISYGIRANKRIGPLNINYKGQQQAYNELATALKQQANTYTDAAAITTQGNNCHIFAIGMDDDPSKYSQLGPWNYPWYGSQS